MITLPQDVELGMLFRLAACREIVLDSKEYRELVLFKNARNCLAHMDAVGMEEVEVILGHGKVRWTKL